MCLHTYTLQYMLYDRTKLFENKILYGRGKGCRLSSLNGLTYEFNNSGILYIIEPLQCKVIIGCLWNERVGSAIYLMLRRKQKQLHFGLLTVAIKLRSSEPLEIVFHWTVTMK